MYVSDVDVCADVYVHVRVGRNVGANTDLGPISLLIVMKGVV